MAYQLANYTTDSGITLDAAYLRITNIQLAHENEFVLVTYEIYANATAASNGSKPVKIDNYAFTEDLYTDNFVCELGVDPLGTQPTNINDVMQCQSYLALKNHPSLTTLLTGATAV